MYQKIEVESSYLKFDIGLVLYNQAMFFLSQNNHNLIIDFGILNGYSTIAFAQAIRDHGRGKVLACDIFEDYPYKKSNKETVINNLIKYNLLEYVEFQHMNYYEWLKLPNKKFSLLHVDISNDGDTIEKTYEAFRFNNPNKINILFEGGSKARDTVEWMTKFNKRPINDVKEKTGYEVLIHEHPSLSRMVI